MARIRSIHPGLFTDEAFMQASICARVFLIGLWTEADDNGIFEWKPIVLRARLLPADTVSGADILAELESLGIIRSFMLGDRKLGAVKNFVKFQRPKSPKVVYEIPEEIALFVKAASRDEDPEVALRRRKWEAQDGKCCYCGTGISYYSKRHDSLEIDHDIPRSRGGSDDDDNLVAACRGCNRSKNAMTGDEFRASLRKRISATGNAKGDAKRDFAPLMEDEGGEEKEGGGRKEDEEEGGERADARRPPDPENLAPKAKAKRFDRDWQPSAESVAFAKAAGLSDDDLDRSLGRFRNHFAGSPHRREDWNDAFRNWISDDAAKSRKGGAPPKGQPATPAATIWVRRGSPEWDRVARSRGRQPVPKWEHRPGGMEEGVFARPEEIAGEAAA